MTKLIDLFNTMDKAQKQIEKRYTAYAIRKSRKGQMPLTMAEWIYKNLNKDGAK